jgi:hypothetical protein
MVDLVAIEWLMNGACRRVSCHLRPFALTLKWNSFDAVASYSMCEIDELASDSATRREDSVVSYFAYSSGL